MTGVDLFNMALSDAEVEKQVRYCRYSPQPAECSYGSPGLSGCWLRAVVMWCVLLQIKHMKRFIEQEAQEKAEEIMIKVGVV